MPMLLKMMECSDSQYVCIYSNVPAEWDLWSIFKQSITCLNTKILFSLTGSFSKT